MARVSRKQSVPVRNREIKIRESSKFQAAAYIRQSHEEMVSGTQSNKLENQEQVIREYVEKQTDLQLLKVYTDNGYSGTNFSRPSFMEMLEDVQKGKINCILVKDLSRLGRNYIETEQYIRWIFPKLKVRFIAVNDAFDSTKDDMELTVSLKNIINDAYAKDISRKISTTKQAQQQRGDFIGTLPPYGYQKAVEDPHRLVADPEACDIIKEIFEWKLQGKTCTEIARQLNKKEYLPPMTYWYKKGKVHNEKYAHRVWERTTVKVILQNQMYTGDMVQGKKKQYMAGGTKKPVACRKEDYIVVPNCHEAIIDREVFEQVQKILEEETEKNRKRRLKNAHIDNTEDVLKDKVYSAEGIKMYRMRHVYAEDRVTYSYATYQTHKKDGSLCSFVNISEEKALYAVKTVLACYAEILSDVEKLFRNSELSRAMAYREKMWGQKRQSLLQEEESCRKRMSQLYQSFRGGAINKEEYEYQRNIYKAEQEKQKEKLLQLEKEKISTPELLVEDALEEYQKFLEKQEISRSLVERLVKKIVVEEKNKVHIDLQFGDEIGRLCKWKDVYEKGSRTVYSPLYGRS